MQLIFHTLSLIDQAIWEYLGISFIIFSGIYFSVKSKFFQLKVLLSPRKYLKPLFAKQTTKRGVHPIQLYSASIGGMIGLGNMVAVMSTITVAGKGSILWMWLASLLGMLIKYSEIYLGIKYRQKTNQGYDGGPMYYLKHAFKGATMSKVIPLISCVFLCIYSVEVSQFLIITDTLVNHFSFNKYIVIISLIAITLMSASGEVKRLATICSTVMPIFMLSYISICIYIILSNTQSLFLIFKEIFVSALYEDFAKSGLAGVMLAMHYGVSRAVYSGDIGIGYDSIIQSETKILEPSKQAMMAIFALFADTLICTMGVLVVLITGVWQYKLPLSEYIIKALSMHLPYASLYMAIIFFIAGFTTIIGYLVVGRKCSRFIHPKLGTLIFSIYAMIAFFIFSFQEQSNVMLVMSVSGGILMIINLLGVFKLRHDIKFE